MQDQRYQTLKNWTLNEANVEQVAKIFWTEPVRPPEPVSESRPTAKSPGTSFPVSATWDYTPTTTSPVKQARKVADRPETKEPKLLLIEKQLLIEPDVRSFGIRLSDWLHRESGRAMAFLFDLVRAVIILFGVYFVILGFGKSDFGAVLLGILTFAVGVAPNIHRYLKQDKG
jgi:small-conductance mechanosensitive channel